MNIIIYDEAQLEMLLGFEGFSDDQIQEGFQIIQEAFEKTAHIVFADIMGKPLPENITLETNLSDIKELEGDDGATLAWFYSAKSTDTTLHFSITEKTVTTLLTDFDKAELAGVTFHEMLHAADKAVLKNGYTIMHGLQNEIMYNNQSGSPNELTGELALIFKKMHQHYIGNRNDSRIALFAILQMLSHYRAEGIAVLGQHLWFKQEIMKTDIDPEISFRQNFVCVVNDAIQWMRLYDANGPVFNNLIFKIAYIEAPYVMLRVLYKKNAISDEILQKALDVLKLGKNELREEEIKSIIRASLSLSLSEFIQGLMLFGDTTATPLLNFCATLQNNYEKDKIDSFIELLEQPDNVEAFNAAMAKMVKDDIPDEEFDSRYDTFCNNPPDETLYPKIREKVDELYTILKNDSNPDRKKIAHYALNYLFFDEDIIYDNTKGLGLVDDVTVIDHALKILKMKLID